ncbi:uncharacterized protein BP01DRAFT_33638 [Aspergillus saccharolyticus JOP 1030-1]|uniref:Uncharacterized protein n=1 Tax=Aspergillus saccharolyticus JOP 1030-1 TaxID=1450539 RepID=A0A318ZQ15_9EURO|nr:hypothetical protein BP01DRAFT_33638 [Aspergillus saccharolyticus JOP 1030-1]PYH46030.1 hypothetical protein BP01DRAFT_33638 [Aspergillus saccharolyticus JOP 1030-1]
MRCRLSLPACEKREKGFLALVSSCSLRVFCFLRPHIPSMTYNSNYNVLSVKFFGVHCCFFTPTLSLPVDRIIHWSVVTLPQQSPTSSSMSNSVPIRD